MAKAYGTREHLNLYYLFQEDQAAHPMPAEQVERLRSYVLDAFARHIAVQETDPP